MNYRFSCGYVAGMVIALGVVTGIFWGALQLLEWGANTLIWIFQ